MGVFWKIILARGHLWNSFQNGFFCWKKKSCLGIFFYI